LAEDEHRVPGRIYDVQLARWLWNRKRRESEDDGSSSYCSTCRIDSARPFTNHLGHIHTNHDRRDDHNPEANNHLSGINNDYDSCADNDNSASDHHNSSGDDDHHRSDHYDSGADDHHNSRTSQPGGQQELLRF